MSSNSLFSLLQLHNSNPFKSILNIPLHKSLLNVAWSNLRLLSSMTGRTRSSRSNVTGNRLCDVKGHSTEWAGGSFSDYAASGRCRCMSWKCGCTRWFSDAVWFHVVLSVYLNWIADAGVSQLAQKLSACQIKSCFREAQSSLPTDVLGSHSRLESLWEKSLFPASCLSFLGRAVVQQIWAIGRPLKPALWCCFFFHTFLSSQSLKALLYVGFQPEFQRFEIIQCIYKYIYIYMQIDR